MSEETLLTTTAAPAGAAADGAAAETTSASAAGAAAGESAAAKAAPDADAAKAASEAADAAAEGAAEKEAADKVAADAAELALNQKVEERVKSNALKTFTDLNATWVAEAKSDPEFGGEKLAENLALARASMEAVAPPKLVNLLKQSGLGNHPEIIRHFLKIGPAFAPDKFVPGGKQPAGAGKTTAQILYPNAA